MKTALRPHLLKSVLLILVLMFAAASASAAVIESKPAGGYWIFSSAWIGGVVPGPNDDVILNGPVWIVGVAEILSLTITASGSLANFQDQLHTLTVTSDVVNEGVIEDGNHTLTMFIGGDITNNGIWTNWKTNLTGTADRELSMAPGATFTTNLLRVLGATGEIFIPSAFTLDGHLDATGGNLVLGAGAPLTIVSGFLYGDFLCNGNQVTFINPSRIYSGTWDQAVISGEVELDAGVNFTGGLVFDGTMSNVGASLAVVTVAGGFTNNGLLKNSSSSGSLTIVAPGDVTNNGTIRSHRIIFEGSGIHHLYSGAGALYNTTIVMFYPDIGTIVVPDDLRSNGEIDLGGGTLIVEPGVSLDFLEYGDLNDGTVQAGGADIHMGTYGVLSGLIVDSATLHGCVCLTGDLTFTENVTITDTLMTGPFATSDVDIRVGGLIRNLGLIAEDARELTIIAEGDLENLGDWQHSRLEVAGTSDQIIAAGSGLTVPEFVIEAGFVAGGYQWYKDGGIIGGAVGPQLVFNGVGVPEYGSYHCQGNGGEISRTVLISENLDILAAVIPTASITLAQNHPNPFNPSTDIHFTLGSQEKIRLSVYDVAGREVDVLVNGEMNAGSHSVTWRPVNIPSGVFFYRLQTPRGEIQRKCTLLK